MSRKDWQELEKLCRRVLRECPKVEQHDEIGEAVRLTGSLATCCADAEALTEEATR